MTTEAAMMTIEATLYFTTQNYNIDKVKIYFFLMIILKIYKKLPLWSRFLADLRKIAKENIAFKINRFTYEEFLERSAEITLMISRELSQIYSDDFYCNVIFFFFNLKLTLFFMDRIMLENKHLNSQMNKFIVEQEKISQEHKNEITLVEAEIELLSSQAEKEIEEFRQNQKKLGTEESSTLRLGRFLLISRC